MPLVSSGCCTAAGYCLLLEESWDDSVGPTSVLGAEELGFVCPAACWKTMLRIWLMLQEDAATAALCLGCSGIYFIWGGIFTIERCNPEMLLSSAWRQLSRHCKLKEVRAQCVKRKTIAPCEYRGVLRWSLQEWLLHVSQLAKALHVLLSLQCWPCFKQGGEGGDDLRILAGVVMVCELCDLLWLGEEGGFFFKSFKTWRLQHNTKVGVYSAFVHLLGSLFSETLAYLGKLWPACFYLRSLSAA